MEIQRDLPARLGSFRRTVLRCPCLYMIAKTSVPSETAQLESAPAPVSASAPASAASVLSGWGRLPAPGKELQSERLESVTRGAALCRGLGRSYGDSSLPAQPSDKVVSTVLADRLADDSIIDCSPQQHADLFWASVGGMGLLGHILEVEFQLEPIASPWIWQESERIGNIDEFLSAFAGTASQWPMTMGWIDCVSGGSALGRGILIAGRWATPEEAKPSFPAEPRKLTFPFPLPRWSPNPFTNLAHAFNVAYYYKHIPRQRRGIVSPETFFYPLDAILHWNRVYGSQGFTQFQCVLPRAAGAVAVREFMVEVTRLGGASPVCVIKDCGPEGQGLLSFPLEGTSIAIDMAVTSDTQRIVDRLNDFVIAAGGRIYLTKDRFTRAEHFRAMEPRLPRFLAAREQWDPGRKLRSAQSVRLFGDRA